MSRTEGLVGRRREQVSTALCDPDLVANRTHGAAAERVEARPGRSHETAPARAGLTVQLLGQASIERPTGSCYRFRSRKSWALLAYLLLTDRAPTRAQLAALLFAEADDPLRALRWSLAEIRRGLGDHGSLDGDPLVLRLASDAAIDTHVLAHGSWVEAVGLPGLGAELLEGMALQHAPAYESWLLAERRRLAAASEAALHEAALGLMARGMSDRARTYAVRAAAMSPLDENHQALLIRLYRLAGDDEAAEHQYAACARLLDDEFGMPPGAAVEAAYRERRREPDDDAADASVVAHVESGSAAVAAGAVEAGVTMLRTAVLLADRGGTAGLRVRSRLVLAEALIHSLRGLDEEGSAHLHEADRIAVDGGEHESVAQARAELGYVDFLRARYDRAEHWLTDALTWAPASPAITAKATTYLGSVASDRGSYGRATALLDEAGRLSRVANDPRREAYVLSMLGRLDLLRGDFARAAERLDASVGLAEGDHWRSFLPWPQALHGELHLVRHETAAALEVLQQAFARACQLGDPCWEGIAGRGLAIAAEQMGEPDRAFATLADARVRANRLEDPYVWLDVHILDAQCELGRRHGHPETRRWVETMGRLAARTGMKEMTVRALLHGAALGSERDATAARVLGAELDNPRLHALL